MVFDKLIDIDNFIIRNTFIISEYNLLIWPLIRWNLLINIKNKQDSTLKAHAGASILSVRIFKYLFDSILFAPHKLNKNFDIIFFVTAKGRNRLSNFFIENTLVMDYSIRYRYSIPDNTDNYATYNTGGVTSFIFNPIKMIFSKKKNPDIERFIDFLRTEEIVEVDYCEQTRKVLYGSYFSYKSYSSYLTKVFKKLNPNLVFVHCGSYGGDNAILLKTAKENGILTGEFQHGTISKDHFAYNYGDQILKSKEYKKYLPEYILTFGDYWNTQIKIPSKVVTIGAPHFYESIKKYKDTKVQKNSILIVSQGTVTNIFVEIAKYLSESLPDYKIIFKLHPGEVPFEDRYKILYKYSNIQVAKSGDIYKYIAQCENIVAYYSTTIFEAMGFDKNIFVLDDKASKIYIPKDIGIRFKEKEELKEMIIQNGKQDITYDLEYYFNSNWKENYKTFILENSV
jgi:hypothetical protein